MVKKFTPAPWEVFMDGETKPGIVNNNIMAGDVVMFGYEGEQCGVLGRSKEEAMANANLIACAPELLEAVEMQQKMIAALLGGKPYRNGDETIAYVESIVKKAYGEQ